MSFDAKSSLLNGEDLHAGERLTAPDEQVYLILQTDGHLAIYRNEHPEKLIWKSTINPKVSNVRGPFLFKMQEDNNAVVYDGQGQPIWHTSTYSPEFAGLFHFELDDDGSCYVRGHKNEIVWTSYSSVRCFSKGKEGMSILDKGQELHTGQCLVSTNEQVCLTVQSNGHVAIYKKDTFDEPVWQSTIDASVSSMEGPFIFKIADDNNAAVYDRNRQLIWKTNLSSVRSDCRLVLEDDGRLLLHLKDDSNSPIWAIQNGSTIRYT